MGIDEELRPKDEPRQPPDGTGSDSNSWMDFKGEKRSNDTHESRTDPEAKLLRKGRGQAAKLCFAGHVLMENRAGLIADILITPAVGTTESEAALGMMDRTLKSNRNRTVGGDKGYDNAKFVEGARMVGATPHVACNTARPGGSALDARTTSSAGYAVSLKRRMRIEEIFGWMKTIGGLRKTRVLGVAKTQVFSYLVAAAYNLLRMAKLCTA